MVNTAQWCSKGGASGGTRPRAQAVGAQQHTFCSHFKVFLSRNLDQSMLIMRIFWEKNVKFVEFVSSAKCILFRSKKKQVTTANVLPLLLSHFCTYFLIQTLYVLLKGGARICLAPRHRVP